MNLLPVKWIAAALLAGVICSQTMARDIKVANTAQPDATDIRSLVASVTKDCRTDGEKMIALWAYIARNPFYHWCEARENPEITTELGLVYDPIIAFNVYGTVICYQVADLLGNLADQAGIRPRHIGVPGHRVMEACYDGKWHFFDATYDCAAYFLADDGKTVISLEELCKDAARHIRNPKFPSQPCYQFDKYGGKFWPWESKNYVIEKMYTPDVPPAAVHYSTKIVRGHTMQLDLRRGEKLIRNFANEGKWYCPAALYKQWHGDPTQKWIDQGPHDPRNPQFNYANGQLIYQPDWAASPVNFADGCHDQRNVALGKDGKVRPAGHGEGFVVFRVQSPYLIAGKPGRLDADGDSTEGAIFEADFLRKDESAANALAVSTDNGLSWKEVWRNDKTGLARIRLDLTNHVEGTYGYLLKVSLAGKADDDAALANLKLTTSLFMSPVPLPAVRAGDNQFVFQLKEGAGVLAIRADLADAGNYRRFFKELNNLKYDPKFVSHLTPAKSGAPGWAIMEVAGPAGSKIEWMTVHVSLGARAGGRNDESAEVLYAADPAGPWQPAWKSDFSDRNDHWRWDRSFDIRPKAPAGRFFLKFLLTQRSWLSLNQATVNAHYLAPSAPLKPGGVKVTHAWLEDGREKTQTVHPDLTGQTYTVGAAGKDIRNRSVTIEVGNEK